MPADKSSPKEFSSINLPYPYRSKKSPFAWCTSRVPVCSGEQQHLSSPPPKPPPA